MKIATKTQMDALVKNRSVPWQERKPLIKLFDAYADLAREDGYINA
jgi:hypothetical protein